MCCADHGGSTGVNHSTMSPGVCVCLIGIMVLPCGCAQWQGEAERDRVCVADRQDPQPGRARTHLRGTVAQSPPPPTLACLVRGAGSPLDLGSDALHDHSLGSM